MTPAYKNTKAWRERHPNRTYPFPDKNHARNALSRVSQFGSPSLKSKVQSKVHRKFSKIGQK